VSACVVIEDFELQGFAFSHNGAFSSDVAVAAPASWPLVQDLVNPVVLGVSLTVVGGVAITGYVIGMVQHRPCMPCHAWVQGNAQCCEHTPA